MRKIGLIAVAAVLVGTFSGCYESKVPMATSEKSTIEPKLVGAWIQVMDEKDDGEPMFLIVAKLNEREYVVSWAKQDDDATLTRAYSVKVGDVDIMNVQNIASGVDDERTYVFFKYKVSADGLLAVQILNGGHDLLEDKEFATPAEFMTFMKKHVNEAKLFNEPITFKKNENLELRIVEREDD